MFWKWFINCFYIHSESIRTSVLLLNVLIFFSEFPGSFFCCCFLFYCLLGFFSMSRYQKTLKRILKKSEENETHLSMESSIFLFIQLSWQYTERWNINVFKTNTNIILIRIIEDSDEHCNFQAFIQTFNSYSLL